MIVFDDVEIPWENVFFYRHTQAAAFIRATLHRYSMYSFVQRHLRFADLMLGLAYANAQQTGTKMHQGVREKIAQLACYREGIAAHLTAAIEMAQESPSGLTDAEPVAALLRPGARLLAAARDDAPGPRPVRLPDQPGAQRTRCSRTRGRGSGCRSTSGSATSTPSSGAGC